MNPPFQSIEPCSALKKYVACYYFIKSEDSNFTSIHYSFPHTYNSLSIYKDGNFECNPSHFKVVQSHIPNYSALVQKKQQSPVLVDISGRINRATILFKDFGINHFMAEPLSKIMIHDYNHLRSWEEDPSFP